MDHLPYPQDAAFPRVTVPYYGKYKYDGGSFTDYPARCNFDKRAFAMGKYSSTVPPNDHNSFFQAWLFFGLIHEFFGKSLDDDFIVKDDEEPRVTTARLPYWAKEWEKRLEKCSQPERMSECERVNNCLREAKSIIVILDSDTFRQDGESHLSEEVGLSIILLGMTLEGTKNYVTEMTMDKRRLYIEHSEWPISDFALRRLERAGWCKPEITRLGNYLRTGGMLYCGSMRNFGRVIDHSRCSEDRCAAEDVDEETYKTADADGCKGCEHDGPEVPDIESVLARNSFPVIGLTKSETTPDICISVLPHCDSMAYTAISHVWADGLGNPSRNTLPKCQLLRLYQLLHSLQSTKMNTVHLWIDTLCIPLNKEFRKKAISLMYDVYSKAEIVLVLDRSLFSISAESPTEELFFRITASPWMRRAWTLQEGALANFLWVQFADKAINLRRAMECRLLQTESYEISQTIGESFKAMRSMLRFRGNENYSQVLGFVHRGLTHRSTSRPEDKLICFAIMLRCDMDHIIYVNDEENVCTQQISKDDLRTKRLYEQLEFIPRKFLWHKEPTLDIPGFGWAPKNIFSVDASNMHSGLGGLTLTDCGLLVDAPGMVYFGRDMTDMTCIRDFNTSKWYSWRWSERKSFDGAIVNPDSPWTAQAVICSSSVVLDKISNTGVVIRLDWDVSVGTTQALQTVSDDIPQELSNFLHQELSYCIHQELSNSSNCVRRELSNYICEDLSNYIHSCNTISGTYLGIGNLSMFSQTENDQLEMIHGSPQWEEIVDEKGWVVFDGKMLESEQKWCVTNGQLGD